MKADDANKFWLGKLNLVMAMAKGQVRAKGSVPEMLKMLPWPSRSTPAMRRSSGGRAALDLIQDAVARG